MALLDGVTVGQDPRPLRAYQVEAVELLRDSFRAGNKHPVFMAPTGYGKTRLAGEIFRLARERGSRVVFCVPRIDLIDQTLASFWSDGIGDIGVIQADHVETDWSRPVQIASVQTLQRRGYPEAQLVVIDECHLAFQFVHEWMAKPEWARVPFIGLSATPWTKGLGQHWDDLIISATTEQLIEQGYLCKFRVFAPSHPDLSSVHTKMGDYVPGELSSAMSKTPLVADVVETWIRRAEGRPTLCFAVDRLHAKTLQARFKEAGINAGYQDAYTERADRAEIRRDFHAGRYSVVVSVGTLTTGVDWDVRCISLVRPTKSEILYVQMIGRGLRPKTGMPDDCLILDHSDTTERLGFVTDISHDSLDDGTGRQKQDKKAPTPKECPECAYLMPPRTMVCPNCGHERKPPRSAENAAGELVELNRKGGVAKVSAKLVQMGSRQIPLGEFYGELMGYAALHGYKPGWAPNKYREAVGVWPNAYKRVEALPTSYPVLAWIRSRAIAWANLSRKGNHDG